MVAWAVTDQNLLRQLLTDDRVSKDPYQHWPEFQQGRITEEWPLYTWVAVRNMFTAEGADHARLRRLIAKAFTARRTEQLRPRIEELTTRLLDDLAAVPPGEVVDLRDRFAYPLPIGVICQLFGVPDHAQRDLRDAVDVLFHTNVTTEELAAARESLYTVLVDLVRDHRSTQADDLTGALIDARDADDRLAENELVDTLLLLLGAGHETTVNLLDHAIAGLLIKPGQLAEVRAGRRSWADVTEEALRWQSPIAYLPLRYAVTDIALEHDVIRAGEPILAAYAAAGRDPAVHDDPGEFDLSRPSKDHLAFGYGAHYCLGAPLARLEAEIALPRLFDRFPDMALAVDAGELRPVASFVANGHRSLPVRLRGQAAS